MKKLIFTFLTMSIFVLTYGQNEEKIYYDKNWHGCSKTNAEYYRIVSFDESGKPIGQVKDYFITGELQGKADGVIKIDKYNDENSIFIGKKTKKTLKEGDIVRARIVSISLSKNEKKIALTSSSPGKTRSLNFYLAEEKFYIVDLPGFGYAKTAKVERESWQRLIEDYLKVDNNISLAFHLIDSRHKPTELDILLNGYLRELNIPYIILMNKVDKLKQSEFAASKKNIMRTFPELLPGENFFPYSSVTGKGKKEVENILNKLFLL